MTHDEINAEIAAARTEMTKEGEKLKNSTMDSIVISVPCSTFSADQMERIKQICKTYDYSQCYARKFAVEDDKLNFIFPYSEDYEVTKRYMAFVDCFCKGIKNFDCENPAVKAMTDLQKAMGGEAEKAGLTTEEDINNLVRDIRNEVENGEPQ